MNDFDFEELDKAVNELATKTHDEHGAPDLAVPHDMPATQSTPEKSVAQPTPLPVLSAPVPEPPKPAEEPDVEVVSVTQPQKHTRLTDTRPRSRGSFMDIVPPVSRKPGTRAGLSLQPLSKPEEITPEPTPPEPKVASEPMQEPPKAAADEVPVATKPPVTDKSPESPKADNDVAWPDPLDFHGDESGAKEEKQEEPAEAEAASPFLAEAKVEKRPLGAFSNFRSEPEEKPVAKEQAPVKDELTPEKDGTFKEPPTTEPKEKAPTAAEAEKDETSKPDLHGTAMMSIPQQYHTEAKETDKKTRSVFDTKEYHPPLIEAATGEHRGGGSMWGKLFIALVVLALLGVAGYFTYLYVMQR